MEWLGTIAKVFPFWIEHPARGAAAIAAVILAFWSVWPLMTRADGGSAAPPGGSVTINNSTFNAPSQIGGQGNVMNVNQPAYFEKQALVERRKDRLRVRVPVRPGGMWQPGTEMKFSFKLSRPCERWKVDPDGEAFSGTMMNVQTGPEENTDVSFFATTTAQRPGKDIVFDIECPQPVNAGAWGPTGP